MDFDKKYKKNKCLFWEEASDAVKIAGDFLDKNEKIIDLWCWQWRNLKYFLKLWYDTYGIDLSETAIFKLKEDFYDKKDNFIVGDLENFDFEKYKDFSILSVFSLNFLRNQRDFIKNLQKESKKWKIHILVDFLEREDLKRWFLKSDEIKELYKNWKILYYKEDFTKTLFWEKWPFYSLIAKNLEN